MNDMGVRECIEALRKKLDLVSGLHGKENEFSQALSLAISKLSLLEQVEKGGVEKKEFYDIKEAPCELNNGEAFAYINGKTKGYSEAIDLCNASLTKKLEGIGNIIRNFKIELSGKRYEDDFPDKLSQSIISHLTNRKE